ncbi:GNAT family N-acetyltransferase [Clostridium chromiireducens]|uniref:N-acetyltransferase domain-containing protein n=1 Tax=Clostridium chromiireducens TaxID=225345 RepID=A0A1V4J220_9CLOT|nr:GNAT family N-acetyltransferase [Clostridium chromiireducens]OPJ65747.1 hypothetical protein CLCHR_05230 [Clostridium chromiireducens]
MSDMLVKLYNLNSNEKELNDLLKQCVRIKRALAPDRRKVLEFVKENFEEGYLDECTAALSNNSITCYIATKNKTIIGFACFEATAKNYFGPTGVQNSERRKGIGKALLNKCLMSMWEMGYGYAIIGWPVKSAIGFYEKLFKHN